MSQGKYFEANQERIALLSDNDWIVAIKKCKDHLKWKLKQKTLFGAHASSNLGEDPESYYLHLAYEKLLSGDWEWKERYSLSEQLIRIIDSWISKEVEKVRTSKSDKFKVIYGNVEDELDFYGNLMASEPDEGEASERYEHQVNIIESAIEGEEDLMEFWEVVRAGYKREDAADYLEIKPKQLDKVKEKFFRRVRNYYSSVK